MQPNGIVDVDVSRTSVKFTVLENGYFDAPESTIGAEMHIAGAFDAGESLADVRIFGWSPGFNVPSYGTWKAQAENLQNELNK